MCRSAASFVDGTAMDAAHAILEHMRKIADIRTFEDRGFQRRMLRASAAVIAVGAVLGIIWFAFGIPRLLGLPGMELRAVFTGEGAEGMPPSFWWLAICSVGCFVSLAAHEVVHAVFFKLFAPAGTRVTFGANWKAGMLYACAKDIVYTRRQYLAIALAPTVVVTALLLVLGVVTGWPLVFYLVAVLHLSGCTGDWEYVRAIVRDARIAYCEDTEWGVSFFGEGDESEGKKARRGLAGDVFPPTHLPACQDESAERVGRNTSPTNPEWVGRNTSPIDPAGPMERGSR